MRHGITFLLTTCFLFTAVAALGQESDLGVQVLSVSAAGERDHIVFAVVVRRPEDMAATLREHPPWRLRGDPWPRVAELRADPPWACAVHPERETDPTTGLVPYADRLTFVGRCRRTAGLDLKLRYPLDGGQWRQVPLNLDLSKAKPLSGDPPPLHATVPEGHSAADPRPQGASLKHGAPGTSEPRPAVGSLTQPLDLTASRQRIQRTAQR